MLQTNTFCSFNPHPSPTRCRHPKPLPAPTARVSHTYVKRTPLSSKNHVHHCLRHHTRNNGESHYKKNKALIIAWTRGTPTHCRAPTSANMKDMKDDTKTQASRTSAGEDICFFL
ncbi:unnamed protein product, partial [Ectocarpus sp. 12 AP-2014]